MSTKKTAALVAIAACLTLPTVASAAPVTVVVDSGQSTVTRANAQLAAGSFYNVTVTGNFSSYQQSLWNQPSGSFWVTCGTTKPIQFKQSDQPAGSVGGQDAEYLYAGLAQKGCGNFRPPTAKGGLQISTTGDNGLYDPTPIGGVPAAPTSLGTYTYRVEGHGSAPRFFIPDSTHSDNIGRIRATFDPAAPVL